MSGYCGPQEIKRAGRCLSINRPWNQSKQVSAKMVYPNSIHPPTSHSSLISISEASSRFGVSAATLRRWHKSGKITGGVFRTNCRGHRRFDPTQIAKALGQEVNSEENGGRIPIAYCRTSSLSQKLALISQCSRARSEVANLENIQEEDVVIYQECKSAFSSREKLNAMTDV